MADEKKIMAVVRRVRKIRYASAHNGEAALAAIRELAEYATLRPAPALITVLPDALTP